MRPMREFVEKKIFIESLSKPIEDYINETGKDIYFYDKRFDIFNNNWNDYNEYLYETLLYSYSLDKFRQRISKIFIVLYYELDNDNVLWCRFGENFNKDNKEFKSICNLFNVFINKIENRNENLVDVCFEQVKPKKITNEVYKSNDFLYHLTTSKNVEKILKYGLQPKSHSKKTYHPERIYLFKQDIPLKYLDNMKIQLDCDIILKVDITILEKEFNKKLEFYEDPMTVGNYGMFTESTIYPNVISIKQ